MRNKAFQRWVILIVLVSTVFTHYFSDAAYCSTFEVKKPKATEGYCGLYCCYMVLGLYDVEIEFKEILKPEYMGSSLGSSMSELELLIEDNGLQSEIITNLTVSDISLIHSPAILHVKSEDSKKYDHYILLVKSFQNKVQIYDPAKPMQVISKSELASIWDGNALIVCNDPRALASISASYVNHWEGRIASLTAIISLCWILKYIGSFLLQKYSVRLNFMSRAVLSFASVFIIVGISIVAAMSYHIIDSGGFFASLPAAERVQDIYAGSFIEKVSVGKMHRIYEGGEAVVFDARLKRDFEAGHIEGAVSLPIDCSDEDYADTIKGLSKDKRIVLYCQSSGCKFAEEIAVRLKDDGFENLSVFRGGWVEWQEANDPQPIKAEGKKNDDEIIS